jgi:hypothetical protein
MSGPIAFIEVRWRPSDSSGEWLYMEVAKDATSVNITGIARGVAYDVEARSVGPTGLKSIWVSIVHTGVTNPSVVEVFSSGGVLILDCQTVEQFKIRVIENITSIQFINVALENTVVLDVILTGAFTVAIPSNVVPVNGIAYVPTSGGTPTVPAADVLGFHTDSAGVIWALRIDLNVSLLTVGEPGTGTPGTGLTFAVTVAPNPAYDYSASGPSLGVVATVYNGTGALTYLWERAAGGAGNWSGSSDGYGGPDFAISSTTVFNPTFTKAGGADGLVAQNWRLTVTDSLGLIAQVILEIALEDAGEIIGGGGPPDCVWVEAYLPDGRKAHMVKVGSYILGVDPITLRHKMLRVSYSKTAWEQGYRLTAANAVELTMSKTAPMPTPGGALVLAPDMLGLETITNRDGITGWSRIISVEYVGLIEVQHITAEDGVFLAGNYPDMFMGHHNIKFTP